MPSRDFTLMPQQKERIPANDRSLCVGLQPRGLGGGTGIDIQEGLVPADNALIHSEMDDGGVVFGDGIEQDRLEFPWGARLDVRCAAQSLRLLRTA